MTIALAASRKFAPVFLALCAPAALHAAAPDPAAAGIIALPLKNYIPASQRACTTTLPSGLGYAPLRAGSGPKPGPTDFALLAYVGYLAADGLVFDSSEKAAFQLDQVVPGFGTGVTLMSKGAVYRLCIPAALGYGAHGTGPIPANADLVFQVELLDFKSAAEVEAMRKAAETPAPAPEPAPAPAPAAKP